MQQGEGLYFQQATLLTTARRVEKASRDRISIRDWQSSECQRRTEHNGEGSTMTTNTHRCSNNEESIGLQEHNLQLGFAKRL